MSRTRCRLDADLLGSEARRHRPSAAGRRALAHAGRCLVVQHLEIVDPVEVGCATAALRRSRRGSDRSWATSRSKLAISAAPVRRIV
jgi:hypothetical protein